MPRDLWRFVSLDTATVLAIGGGAAFVAHGWDDYLVSTIEVSPRLNSALEPGQQVRLVRRGARGAFAVYGVGRMAGHGRLAVVGADLVRAQMVTQLWVQALKFTVQRERPDGSNDVSFPSGHAAGAVVVAGVVGRHYGWKVG